MIPIYKGRGEKAISTKISLVSRKSRYHILKQLDEKGYEVRTPYVILIIWDDLFRRDASGVPMQNVGSGVNFWIYNP